MSWKTYVQQPPKEYRSIPFWSLNDELDPEELRWQIREMKRAGIGGYFMHARSGLRTEYLSEQWMEAIEACVDEGEKVGMSPWLYDEDGWPSGFAGGIVPAEGLHTHQKWLVLEERGAGEHLQDMDRVVGVYRLNQDKSSFYQLDPSSPPSAMPGETEIVLRWDANPYYVDTLDVSVIRSFIESTHEAYRKRFGEKFGPSGIPGIFTDEPQYAGSGLPWSFVLEEEFRNEHGYSLIPVLPALYYDTESHEGIRYDYWKTVNRLFSAAFSKEISDWCEKHGLEHTGHVVNEDSLQAQMFSTGGAMSFYRYMQMPGIDWLGRWVGCTATPKQVSSVARQLGKKRVLTETFGCCGWDVTFEELKWIAEWQYVLGINMMCQHLQWYSMRGLRKRDYPPSLYYQQPYWDDYVQFNDYFARLGVLLAEGRHMPELLLIHPMRSAWITYKRNSHDQVNVLNDQFSSISGWLLELHYDFDYGDEGLLADYRSVDHGSLVVGEARYKAVVVPPVYTLDSTTVRLLEQFASEGGTVIWIGERPELVNGRREDSAGKLASLASLSMACPYDRAAMREMLEAHVRPSVSITAKDGGEAPSLYYQLRDMGDGERVLYVVNISREAAYHPAVVAVQGQWRASRIVLENGQNKPVAASVRSGYTQVELEFQPMQSYALLLTPASDEEADREEAAAANGEPEFTSQLSGSWRLEPTELNALTLDYAELSLDGGEWSSPIPAIEIQEMLMKRGGTVDVGLRYTFTIADDAVLLEGMFAAIEKPEQYVIEVNGRALPSDDAGWWRDKCLRKLPLEGYVRHGLNEIVMRLTFHTSDEVHRLLTTEGVHECEWNKVTYDVEIESIYVIGGFGVYSRSVYEEVDRGGVITDGPFDIRLPAEQAPSGDLTGQGFPFYAGNMRLIQAVDIPRLNSDQRCILDLGRKPSAVLSKISVNGKLVRSVMWAPYSVDISDYIEEGRNEIIIELCGSCRNLLGPHHHVMGQLHGVGPSSFTKRKGWIEGYLEDDNIWRDRYSMVRFGLEEQPKLHILLQ